MGSIHRDSAHRTVDSDIDLDGKATGTDRDLAQLEGVKEKIIAALGESVGLEDLDAALVARELIDPKSAMRKRISKLDRESNNQLAFSKLLEDVTIIGTWFHKNGACSIKTYSKACCQHNGMLTVGVKGVEYAITGEDLDLAYKTSMALKSIFDNTDDPDFNKTRDLCEEFLNEERFSTFEESLAKILEN